MWVQVQMPIYLQYGNKRYITDFRYSLDIKHTLYVGGRGGREP